MVSYCTVLPKCYMVKKKKYIENKKSKNAENEIKRANIAL